MRFHRLDLNTLLVLDALLELRSVSRAARKLNVGQPALSAALGKLREHFGDPLFVKVGREMQPTALTQSLAEPTRELLQQAERVARARQAFDPLAARRRFVVSVSDYTSTVLMPTVYRLLAREAPSVQLILRSTPMPSVAEPQPATESLERRGHDFAIVPSGAHSARHRAEQLLSDGFVCIARREHPQVRGVLDATLFGTLPHVVTEFDEGRVSTLDSDALATAGIARRIGAVVDRFNMLGEVVAATDCVATLPSRLAQQMMARLPLQLMPLPATLQVPPLVEMVQWKPAHDEEPAMRWMRALLHRAAAEV